MQELLTLRNILIVEKGLQRMITNFVFSDEKGRSYDCFLCTSVRTMNDNGKAAGGSRDIGGSK